MDYYVNGFPVHDTGPNGGGIGGCLLIIAIVFFGLSWLVVTILPYIIMGIVILIAVVLAIFLLVKMLPVWIKIIRMVTTDICHVSKWVYAKYWKSTEKVE